MMYNHENKIMQIELRDKNGREKIENVKIMRDCGGRNELDLNTSLMYQQVFKKIALAFNNKTRKESFVVLLDTIKNARIFKSNFNSVRSMPKCVIRTAHYLYRYLLFVRSHIEFIGFDGVPVPPHRYIFLKYGYEKESNVWPESAFGINEFTNLADTEKFKNYLEDIISHVEKSDILKEASTANRETFWARLREISSDYLLSKKMTKLCVEHDMKKSR